jgi:peptidoglycan hydrolase CwlO-like protein
VTGEHCVRVVSTVQLQKQKITTDMDELNKALTELRDELRELKESMTEVREVLNHIIETQL